MSFRDAARRGGVQRFTLSVGAHVALAGMLLGVTAYVVARETGVGWRYVYASAAWGIAVAIIILVNARHHLPQTRFGPANRVTLVRGVLVALIGGAIGLVDEAGLAAWTIFMAAVAALLLDGVDGWLARRSGVASPFGARFDWELDALFLVILSVLVYDLGKAGAWVLAIGGLRYAFVVARFLWPHLAVDLPESVRRKVVCVVQGVVLIACLAPVVGQVVASVSAGGALAVLCVSFAVDIAWLNRNAREHRHAARSDLGSSRRMTAIFDRLAEQWDIEHGPTSERAEAFAVQVRYLTTHCAGLVRPRVLDIGCGTGQHLIGLVPWIGASVGIDLSSRMVERAAANARAYQCRALRFLQQDAEELTHERFGGFDLVLFVGSLEHLPAPAIALRKARLVLRREGRIVIIMPHWLNPTHWWNRRGDRVPVRHLSLPALRAVAAQEGLVLEQAVALPHGIDLLRPFGTMAERLFSGRLARAGAVLRGAFGVSLRHAADP